MHTGVTRSPEIFQEEREFLQEIWGMTDPQIAEHWRMAWPTYTRYLLRHPELPPPINPEHEALVRHEQLTSIFALKVKRRPGERASA